jgi:chromate transport protein ChrA
MMVQGLGLAESTPGPLIMVTQYVGFIGAWNDPGPFSPLLYGTLGALVTTYATFLPCFLFIFFLAPYIELLSNDSRLRAILVGVTAAVVGAMGAGQTILLDGLARLERDLRNERRRDYFRSPLRKMADAAIRDARRVVKDRSVREDTG